MQSRKLPALLALAGVVIAIVLFLVLKDDTADDDATLDDAPTQEETAARGGNAGGTGSERSAQPERPAVPTVEIRNGTSVGGTQKLEFASGERARFQVKADAPDELHFHGYDLYIDVGPGEPTPVSFKADIEGLFELESHSTGELIAEVSVVP